MERRDFFKGLAGGLAALVIAGHVSSLPAQVASKHPRAVAVPLLWDKFHRAWFIRIGLVLYPAYFGDGVHDDSYASEAFNNENWVWSYRTGKLMALSRISRDKGAWIKLQSVDLP